jgi:hypothetical protein
MNSAHSRDLAETAAKARSETVVIGFAGWGQETQRVLPALVARLTMTGVTDRFTKRNAFLNRLSPQSTFLFNIFPISPNDFRFNNRTRAIRK